MNKICTSIEQSQKLKELGIDINTADMYYPNRVGMDNYALSIEWKKVKSLLSQEIPAWSLTALLELIPNWNMDKANSISLMCNPYYHCESCYEDPVDAAFEMICWLKENNCLC